VYHSAGSTPSATMARSPSACAVASGTRRTCSPPSVGTLRQACTEAGTADIASALQRRHARAAVGHAMLDLVEIVHAVPEHLPLLLLEAAVGLGVVEDVDLVVVARTPEQLRGF